jgi:hypothetical protein
MNEQQLAAVKQALGALKIVRPMENPEPAVEEAITALQSIISQDALDKKADNARELGLSYDDAIKGGVGIMLGGKRIDPASIYADAPPKQDVPETNFGNMAEPKIGCVNHDCDKCKGDQRARQALDEANAYALELQARLAKYEGGATMMLNTAPQPVPVKTYHDGKPWPVAPKPWVGLSDKELQDLMAIYSGVTLYRAIENKLRERNT